MYAQLNQRPSPWSRALRVVLAGVAGGALVTAVGLGVNHAVNDAAFRIDHVSVVGNQRASVVQLRHLARVPDDAHIATVDLDAVRRGVERHPWVRQATVFRSFPGGLVIEVLEHQPAMLLALDHLWYVDGNGRPIKLAESRDLDYPVLTGMRQDLAEQRPDLAAAIVQGALRVAAACDGQPIRPEQISEIHHDPLRGFELVLHSGTRLVLGNSNPAPAMARLQRMIAAGLDLDQPQRIDLDVETVAIATPLPPLAPPPPTH